ncbi:MAG: pyruvate, phosphate dikinase [Myxococcales bacterium]|nr:pyruvate, phosphate dikinase [Myxococcales bacterium]MCB9522289.1 pyruvate, phosphate dikinase [Myxococcales bacterium]
MRVYTFGDGQSEGRGSERALLGGKGAGLARLAELGLPVPPGFTLPTDLCGAWLDEGERAIDSVWPEVERGLAHIETSLGLRLGDPDRPLLVSVRSGAATSMPGMMDTVLNVGLNRVTRGGLAAQAGGRRFALDSHRRLLEMYAETVLGAEPGLLADVREGLLDEAGLERVADLPDALLEAMLAGYQVALRTGSAGAVPDDPRAQLRGAIAGVLASWNSRRAARFRRQRGIPDRPGTAVTIQAMVFGNSDDRSGTGVAYSRNPNTGVPGLFGEFLVKAQGEEVVGGHRTPAPLAGDGGAAGPSLSARLPEAYRHLDEIAQRIERELGDVHELEFTVERGRVWVLQIRAAERSATAEVQVAVDFALEGRITADEALGRVDPERLTRLVHPSVDLQTGRRVIARGLPASPGAVSGVAVFDPDEAVRRAEAGERVILVRQETSTADLDGIRAAAGILTARGGMTSHAALVARGLGKCCVTGCSDILVDERNRRMRLRLDGAVITEGALLTLDGGSGEVILGQAATRPAEPPAAYCQLMDWADDRRRVSVRVTADQGTEAAEGVRLGADGVGLCRTEHMFMDADRLELVREMVLAFDGHARRSVVARIAPVQRADFKTLLEAAGPRPVAIRLLDLPLHDFMPDELDAFSSVADRLQVPANSLLTRAEQLRARNPQMGHRGCRLGLTFPEVYEVQLRALFEAAFDVTERGELQIVLPLVTSVEEVRRLRRRIDAVARSVSEAAGQPVPAYTVGAMIESPRACLLGGPLAEVSDFFLFGTNDLTSATFCMHRDDAGRFLPFYLENAVLPADPFVRLDTEAVVRLIGLAVQEGRARRPELVCGLSGAQANSPETVRVAARLGLDYVSVAAHRVPVARLAAAQAAAEERD